MFWFAPVFLVVPAAWRLGHRARRALKSKWAETIGLWIVDLNVGILFFLAMGSLGVYGVVMSGWSSNSKYAHFGALRSSAQVISYELVMGLAVLAVIIYAGSLSLIDIVNAQSGLWFIVPQLIGFLLFVIAAVAETNRAAVRPAGSRVGDSWPASTSSTPACAGPSSSWPSTPTCC